MRFVIACASVLLAVVLSSLDAAPTTGPTTSPTTAPATQRAETFEDVIGEIPEDLRPSRREPWNDSTLTLVKLWLKDRPASENFVATGRLNSIYLRPTDDGRMTVDVAFEVELRPLFGVAWRGYVSGHQTMPVEDAKAYRQLASGDTVATRTRSPRFSVFQRGAVYWMSASDGDLTIISTRRNPKPRR
jgi:hypothetical protein